MSPETLAALRWAVMTDEESWRAELDRLLAPIREDAAAVEAAAAFLAERAPNAEGSFRPRMEAMSSYLRGWNEAGPSGDGSRFDAAAARWIALEKQAAELQGALDRVRAEQRGLGTELRAILGTNGARSVGAWRFEAADAAAKVTVVDRMAVPLDLVRREPDLDRIVTRWRQTGAAPPGVRIDVEPGGIVVVFSVTDG